MRQNDTNRNESVFIEEGLVRRRLTSGEQECVGYIFMFGQHGAFSPDGKIGSVSKDQIETHNRILSEAELRGLDENCAIGQCGMFYWKPEKKSFLGTVPPVGDPYPGTVTTWTGTIVAQGHEVQVSGKYGPSQLVTPVITFRRKGKVFRGRLRKNADCFNFKRIA